MIKYTSEGLVTDDPQIAVMFVGKKVFDIYQLGGVLSEIRAGEFCLLLPAVDGYTEKNYTQEILIPWSLVWQAIQSVAGEFRFPKEYSEVWPDSEPPEYSTWPTTHQNPHYYYIANTTLTDGKTTGELRELVEKARPK